MSEAKAQAEGILSACDEGAAERIPGAAPSGAEQKSEPAQAGLRERLEEIDSPPARGTSCRIRRINLWKGAGAGRAESGERLPLMKKENPRRRIERSDGAAQGILSAGDAGAAERIPGARRAERNKKRACEGRAAGADWKRLIRRLAARHELQGSANQSLEGSGSGPCRKRRATTAE